MTLKESFGKVIGYSQEINNPKLDELFADWQKNKQRFIHTFGGFIYEFPEKIQFELDETAKAERLNSLKEYMVNQGYTDLANFIVMNQEGFYNNKTIEEFRLSSGKIIPKNMKLLKAFKYFVQHDPLVLKDFQTKASMLIQEDKIEGYLCFSVHPLDFLSLSENVSHWRSCHALDGTYRAGNLSYMCDETTCICYLRSEDEVILPHFPPEVKWNNKKWRMLLHINVEETLIYAGRQYPFFSKTPLNILQPILQKLFHRTSGEWSDWTNEYRTYGKYHFPSLRFPILERAYSIEDTIEDVSSELHYNDILYSLHYTEPYYSFKLPFKQKIKVGHDVKCLSCGKKTIEKGQGTFRCINCELEEGTVVNNTFDYCCRCGSRVLLDKAYFSNSTDLPYCQYCAEQYLFECEYCGELHDIKELKRDKYGDCICKNCLEKNKELSK